ncbi:trehalose-phosphatase [Erwinia psidii]|uniref:Trehalose 6-phosphate phosphatase n=1 Tax=Erwinia psidii TaxID=69224 RepID=A0A3N6SH63_9GAMM|nr:trehalose-phosphatase [Erwinia psidii]MCX8956262.1 trehalose-phosphatase [Erwinia psidii]MCX8959977.1 trehalose-phosphatase [Erwinia psidii]MCX8963523.1 trehalose-phosphatase [Erwinia psidii]RQM39263.1 trehalose-phosphatase [Erwinia psidii]
MNTQNSSGPSLSQAARYAFFFDVDGTLAAIQSRPDSVFIPEQVIKSLEGLTRISEGALALVSGRPISELDALVAPLHLPLAGVHGAEKRDADDRLERYTLPDDVVTSLTCLLDEHISTMPGAQLETKGMAFALHYRGAEHYQQQVLALAETVIDRFAGLTLQPGKCVVEIKPEGVNKGAAVTAFMQQPPFTGRTPVFIGDDLTDEAAFRAVNAMGGISVKVGKGQTEARYRLPDVGAVSHWLTQTLLQLDQDESTSVRS